MGVFPSYLWPVLQSRSQVETGNAERSCLTTGVPPKIRDTHIEWSSTWEATGSSGPEAWAELWARTVERADQRMGGGRLSLVGAIERAAAGLDALDPQALQVKPEDRETTALDQSAADGPTTGGPEEPTEAADLRAHQAGLSAEASHPGEDR